MLLQSGKIILAIKSRKGKSVVKDWKRSLAVLLAAVLTLPLFGCRKAPEVETTPPSYAPVTVELCAQSSNYSMAQAENGYYLLMNGILYYADKAQLDHWVPVCDNPACNHVNTRCSADVSNAFILKDDRIYTLRDVYTGDGGVEICSMALDGTDLRQEFVVEESKAPGVQSSCASFIVNGKIYGAYTAMRTDGTFFNQIVRSDMENGDSTILYSGSTEDFPPAPTLMPAWFFDGIGGEDLFFSTLLAEDNVMERRFRFTDEGYEEVPELSEYPNEALFGSWMKGNTLDHFVPGEGYVRTDLKTGKSKTLQPSQVPEGSGRWLSEQYLVECNFLGQETPENPQLMFFDGIQWHPVTLPEDLAIDGENRFFVNAVSMEYLFIGQQKDNTIKLYAVSLTDPEYRMFSCGEIVAPAYY